MKLTNNIRLLIIIESIRTKFSVKYILKYIFILNKIK